MCRIILKEIKYNRHEGDIRDDVLPPPHALTQLQCSKINVKNIAFVNKEDTADWTMGVSVLL